MGAVLQRWNGNLDNNLIFYSESASCLDQLYTLGRIVIFVVVKICHLWLAVDAMSEDRCVDGGGGTSARIAIICHRLASVMAWCSVSSTIVRALTKANRDRRADLAVTLALWCSVLIGTTASVVAGVMRHPYNGGDAGNVVYITANVGWGACLVVLCHATCY